MAGPFSRAALLVLAGLQLTGCDGEDLPVGRIEGGARPVEPRAAGTAERQILFGDLHVHTSYSVDAFVFSLPLFVGEGAHPPADACDFARHCSQLDFFSLNDHAEGLTPERWRASLDMLRACDALGGARDDPDLVAFAGWEWTQVGATPETHYGHKNVILRGLAPGDVPARPIASLTPRDLASRPPLWALRAAQWLAPDPYDDFLWWIHRLAELPECEAGVDPRALPPDCRENAATPAELFARLDAWGMDALVIPHGLAWGRHAPPAARLDVQLAAGMHDPARQRLLELASGHGVGERYLEALDPPVSQTGERVCPEPTADLLPCCWRAGELMRERCGELPADECQARVRQARQLALDAGTTPERVIPGSRSEDWLDCDQCRDCFKPVFSPRVGMTAQYALALSRPGPAPDAEPRRLRFGLIASSDDHRARAGTGYKQLHRRLMSDARGLRAGGVSAALARWQRPRGPSDRPVDGRREQRSFGALLDVERGASFLYPGGLVAVHAAGRSRDAIWRALERREVYGTSGPRIQLWFDLLQSDGRRAPMGSAVELAGTPRFEVRAVGASEQLPGCPEESQRALSSERLDALCGGECHHPGERRHAIQAIEVVRIRPQRQPDEPVASLIEDPWRRFACSPDPAGCRVRFDDPDFGDSGRDAVYYVRALQKPTPAINGAQLRTGFDEVGRPVRVRPCYGDDRTPADDDCLAPVQERAWSSPIFVDRPRESRGRRAPRASR